jgi:type VI secretion system protein ImpH
VATDDGRPADALGRLRALAERPREHDFFQALRRVEAAFPEAPRLGTALRPAEEPLRLGQEPTLEFAPAALASFAPGTDGAPHRLSVFFQGLFGPNGPLPTHLTEVARDRLRNHGDRTLACFADVFHHRLLLLFYRAWAQARPAVSHDRPATDRFRTYIGATFGAAEESARDRDLLPDRAKLFYAGLLSAQTKSADSLAALVTDHLGMKARIEELVGEWVTVPEGSRWRLGKTAQAGLLGQSATLGGRAWLCQHKFRIVLGPLTPEQHERMLPGGPGMPRLSALVRNFTGDELRWDVLLLLHRAEVIRLGRSGHLGWSAFVRRAREGAAGEVVLEPERAPI